MKKLVFTGVATALITPLNESGIDYEKMGKLIDWQIDEGVDAIVVCGTTGESATLNDTEHKDAIRYAVDRVNGRIPVIAGTGSNDTAYGVSLAKAACELGADALLAVTPYYNKATQKGLVASYNKMADASTKPLILYNVPSRTGVNIAPKTYLELSKHENIVGFKEANGDISKIVETMSLVGDNLTMYSGNDDQIVPLMAIGCKGVISVVSNVLPKRTGEIFKRFFAGDIEGAAKIQFELHDIIDALFCEVNPIPVKAAMSALGFCDNYLRLPLTEMDGDKKQMMFEIMRKHGLKF